MKNKQVIQRALPLNVKYDIVSVSYQSIEDGGGCSCDNCGRLITNVGTVKSSDNKIYNIGLDCLGTIIINNDLLNSESYLQYLYSDKPAIQKAKALRAKILKNKKADSTFKAEFKEFKNSFGFSFSVFNAARGFEQPMGYDYTFNLKYKELTLNYIKELYQ